MLPRPAFLLSGFYPPGKRREPENQLDAVCRLVCKGLTAASLSFFPAKASRASFSVPIQKPRGFNKCCTSQESPEAEVPLLEMRNITYQAPMNFEKYIFTNMNFKIYPRQFVIVVGENGAGKSTALNLMLGLAKVRRGNGNLFWMGKKMRPRNMIKKIGAIMQNPADFFFTQTVFDEMTLGRNCTPDDVRRVLSATGLTNISLLSDPRSLSGGQIRRLALASQLMREPVPPLFVLDEPLAGVDWTGRRELIQFLGSLKSQFAIILVSHEPAELLKYADRVVQVRRGAMYDIDPKIIKKAIAVREWREAEKRAKALKDAALYRQRKAFEAEVDKVV